MTALEFKNRLVHEISKCSSVKGIGQTGDPNAPLIAGQSDIDLFVLCTAVPSREDRARLYETLASSFTEWMMEVCNGGIWGCGDILVSCGIEVMPMYFTIEEMDQYLEEALKGKHIAKEGRFYPTGRLASVETIHILYEEESAWTKRVEKVKAYPEALFEKLFAYHMSQVLDEEDLGRVLLRKEVLFYHQVLEEALDHLLQAVFALNRCYFPSRKRTQTLVAAMLIKPEAFYDRLLQIVADAVNANTIENSVTALRKVAAETAELAGRKQTKEKQK